MGAASGIREDGRAPGEIRPVEIKASYLQHAEGSASIRMGKTWVVCAATVEDRQPFFLKGTTRGWITAEYGMLPRSVDVRLSRRRHDGRGTEIQRMIGRCLRTVVDLGGLPLHTITLDCDVIEADGGTRSAAITGAFVALCEACRWMRSEGRILKIPIRAQLAAISAGWVRGRPLCDLSYPEDSAAAVDLNLVMTDGGRIAGVHAGAESEPMTEEAFSSLLGLAREGLEPLFRAQREALGLDPQSRFSPEALYS